MLLRHVPALITLPDGSRVGDAAATPAVIHVHDSGWVTVTASRPSPSGPEIYEAYRSMSIDFDRNKGWGIIPDLRLDTEGGPLIVNRGPGCACGHPIKHHLPPDPAWLVSGPPPAPAAPVPPDRPPVPTTPPTTEF